MFLIITIRSSDRKNKIEKGVYVWQLQPSSMVMQDMGNVFVHGCSTEGDDSVLRAFF